MTKQEKEIKKQVILANLENDILDHLSGISNLMSDAWCEIEEMDPDETYTDYHKKVVKIIRKYGFC